MDITAILVSYNTAKLLPQAIKSLRSAATHIKLKIIIVDNASRDNSLAVINHEFSDCDAIINEVNVGFGRANNMALPLVNSPYVLLLNTDAFLSPDSLDKPLEYMRTHPKCGVLGVKLVGRDGELQPSCRYFPTPWNIFLSRTGLNRFFPYVKLIDDMKWDHASPRQCDWVPGCYYLTRREVINQVGLFDPRYFLYYEEVDHCFAAKRAGWEVHYFSDTTVVHIGGESAKSAGELTPAGRQISALQIESELLYFKKHLGGFGLAWHMLLVTVGDLILATKAFLKGRGREAFVACWQNTFVTWRLVFETKFATQPTR